MLYFKCTGAGKEALCCKGISLELTLYEAVKFWEYFPIIYQINAIYSERNGFLIQGNLTAYIHPNKSCPFLRNNLCSIYENRPSICKLFPLNFSFIYRKLLFKPFGINEYKIAKFQGSYPLVNLDICKKCDPNSISNTPKEGYIPLTKFVDFIDSKLIQKDLEYQHLLLIFILQKYPLNDEDLNYYYTELGLRGSSYNFITSHILNLGFLYAISIIGNLDFPELLKTQIKLLSENPILNEENTKMLITSYENFNILNDLFIDIQKFIKQNPYTFIR